MQPPYLPAPDAAFDAWATNFATLITAVPATYGLVAGDAVAINAVVTPWHAAYIAAINPVTRTSVTIAAKDAARTAAEPVLRGYATTISRNPAVSNDDKTAVGVNLPNSARTPVPPPVTQPALTLDGVNHNTQQLSYRDTTTPTTKAKPPGAIGLELRQTIAVGPAVDPNAATPYGVITKSPVVIGTSNGDVGKIATYWGRWTTRSGPGGLAQVGPWSAPLSVAVV